MSFSECDEALSGGFFFGLEADGDSEKAILVGEPIPIDTIAFSKKRVQNVFPIVTNDGLKVWGVGAIIYKEIRDNWKSYSANAITITRKGKKNDKHTTYPIKPCAVPANLKKVYADISVDEIGELLADVVTFSQERLLNV